jgi:hypothetical protein
VLLVGSGLFALYVVHSGGDFMFARRLLPALPFLFLALEERTTRLSSRGVRLAVAGAATVAAFFPYPVFGEGRWRIRGIADEPHFYPQAAIEARRRQAEVIGRALEGVPVKVLVEGGMCSLAYYSGLPYVVEMTGLTHYSLARLPLAERGLVGHEKTPTEAWLDEHEIHLVLSQAFPYVGPPAAGRRHDVVYFSNLAQARIRRYTHAVMDPLLARPGVSAVPVGRVVDQLEAEMRASSFPRARAMYDYLDRYYLRHNNGEPATSASERLLAVLAERREEPR